MAEPDPLGIPESKRDPAYGAPPAWNAPILPHRSQCTPGKLWVIKLLARKVLEQQDPCTGAQAAAINGSVLLRAVNKKEKKEGFMINIAAGIITVITTIITVWIGACHGSFREEKVTACSWENG